MQSSPSNCGWHPPTQNSLTKIFKFATNADLGSFLVELLSCVHDRQFNIHAVESANTHELRVSITGVSGKTLSDDPLISELVSSIERLYLECIPYDDVNDEERTNHEKHRRTVWNW